MRYLLPLVVVLCLTANSFGMDRRPLKNLAGKVKTVAAKVGCGKCK